MAKDIRDRAGTEDRDREQVNDFAPILCGHFGRKRYIVFYTKGVGWQSHCSECASPLEEQVGRDEFPFSGDYMSADPDAEAVADDSIVLFLYLLMRDHLPLGHVIELVNKVWETPAPLSFTNKELAAIALEMKERLDDRDAHDRR